MKKTEQLVAVTCSACKRECFVSPLTPGIWSKDSYLCGRCFVKKVYDEPLGDDPVAKVWNEVNGG